MHDHRGVGPPAVQLGVDVDGRGNVPLPGDDGARGVDREQVGGADLRPPQPPRVHEELGADPGGDVAGQVLAPADVVEVAEGIARSCAGVVLTPVPGTRAAPMPPVRLLDRWSCGSRRPASPLLL